MIDWISHQNMYRQWIIKFGKNMRPISHIGVSHLCIDRCQVTLIECSSLDCWFNTVSLETLECVPPIHSYFFFLLLCGFCFLKWCYLFMRLCTRVHTLATPKYRNHTHLLRMMITMKSHENPSMCFVLYNLMVVSRFEFYVMPQTKFNNFCRVSVAFRMAQYQAEPDDWPHHHQYNHNMQHTSGYAFRRTNEAVPLKMFLSTIAFDTFKYQTKTH